MKYQQRWLVRITEDVNRMVCSTYIYRHCLVLVWMVPVMFCVVLITNCRIFLSGTVMTHISLWWFQSGGWSFCRRESFFCALFVMCDDQETFSLTCNCSPAPPQLHLSPTSAPHHLHLSSTSAPPQLHLSSTSSPPQLHISSTSADGWLSLPSSLYNQQSAPWFCWRLFSVHHSARQFEMNCHFYL